MADARKHRRAVAFPICAHCAGNIMAVRHVQHEGRTYHQTCAAKLFPFSWRRMLVDREVQPR